MHPELSAHVSERCVQLLRPRLLQNSTVLCIRLAVRMQLLRPRLLQNSTVLCIRLAVRILRRHCCEVLLLGDVLHVVLCGIGLDAAVHRLRYGGLHVGLLHAMVRHWVADSIRRVSYGWDTDVLLWCMLHLRLLRPRLRTVTRDATMRKANWRLGRSARWRVRWRVGGVVAAE